MVAGALTATGLITFSLSDDEESSEESSDSSFLTTFEGRIAGSLSDDDSEDSSDDSFLGAGFLEEGAVLTAFVGTALAAGSFSSSLSLSSEESDESGLGAADLT